MTENEKIVKRLFIKYADDIINLIEHDEWLDDAEVDAFAENFAKELTRTLKARRDFE